MLKTKIFTLAALVVVLMSNRSELFSNDTLSTKLIYRIDMKSYALPSLSELGKYAVIEQGGIYTLIDLPNGDFLYKSEKGKESGVILNHKGDKFYSYNNEEKVYKEYDTKTVSFIKNLQMPLFPTTISPDSAYYYFYPHPHSFVIRNIYTNELLDSFKIQGTPETSTYSIYNKCQFSYDGRYFAIGLYNKFNPENAGMNWFIYDRITKEMVFDKYVPKDEDYYSFGFEFFKTKNRIIISDLLQLEGDTQKYTYFVEYDLDTRTVIRNIKISDLKSMGAPIFSTNDKLLEYRLYENDNFARLYDFENNKLLKTIIKDPGYIDGNRIYSLQSGYIAVYETDWTVDVEACKLTYENDILFPNPTNNLISIDNIITAGKTFKMTNISGSEIPILDKMQITNNSISIDMSSLISGTYYLNISDKTSSKTYKISKI